MQFRGSVMSWRAALLPFAVAFGLALPAAASTPLVVETINLPPAYVGTEYPGIQLYASGGVSPYKWSLAAGSALPKGMTLSSSGDVTGDPESPAPGLTFKVNVTDSSKPAKTGSATISMPVYAAVAKCNSTGSSATTLKWLSGNYGFHIDQIDLTGDGVVSWIVGQFKADGQGHVTNMIFDSNGPTFTEDQNGEFSGGSYKIGSDGRGELNLTTPGGAISVCIAVAGLKNGVAGNGQFIEADSSDTVAHGVFYAQGGSAATEASVKGSWAFGVQGAKIHQGGVITRQAAAGYIVLNGAGKVTGELDLSNDKTSGSSLVNQYIAKASISGTYSVASDGRGKLALELSQGGSSQAVNYVFYMAGPGQMLLLESDDADSGGDNLGSSTGRALLRTVSSFSNATLSGSSVFIGNGVSISGDVYGPKTQAGLLHWDNGSASGAVDVNKNGKVTLATANPISAHYSVDANGRVSFGAASVAGTAPYFYLAGPNSGFGVESNTAVDAFDLFDQSVPSGGFKADSFSGGYATGSIWWGFLGQIAQSGEVVADSTTKVATADLDSNQDGQISLGDVSSADFEPAANGRFILLDNGHPSTALYFVSPDLAFGINISGAASQALSEVDFFEQNP